MTQREQLETMLDMAGVERWEYAPDADDRLKGPPGWAVSVCFYTDDEVPTITCFDFDGEGSLLHASSFVDPDPLPRCPDCGQRHGTDDEGGDDDEGPQEPPGGWKN